MELRDRFAATIRRIRGWPGVWVGDPAPESLLDASEQALGHPLPEQLRTLLSLANGLSVNNGLWQILGVGEAGPMPDLVRFNAWETWKYAWSDLVDLSGTLVYKLMDGLFIEGYERGDGGDWVGIWGTLMAPDELERPDLALVEVIERGWARVVERGPHAEDRAITRAVGPLAPGHMAYPGTRYLLKAVPEPTEMLVRPMEEALRMCGGLLADERRLPRGTLVAAPFAETDAEGRERWRWITEYDLPGLQPGRLSYVTIDGQIPEPP